MSAYFRAPRLIWRMSGASRSFAAQMIPWISSMLLTLNAPTANPPFMAASNMRLVLTSGMYASYP